MKKLITPSRICFAMFFMGFGIGISTYGLSGTDQQLPQWVWITVSIILVASSVLYWRLIDEAAKEAHKFA